MNCGLYKIKNKVNSKFYIGSSNNIKRRWKEGHLNKLKKNKHDNQHLQNAWNKYGEDNFSLEIYKSCEPNSLIKEEQKELDVWVGNPLCYNIRRDAKCPTAIGEHRSEEIKRKLSLSQKGKLRWNDEQKRQMSIDRKGRKHSIDTKLKMKNRLSSFQNIIKAQKFNEGRVYSKKHCNNISVAKFSKQKRFNDDEIEKIRIGVQKSIQEGRYHKNKLKDKEKEICDLYLSGKINQKQLSIKYGVCPNSIGKLLKRTLLKKD
jgi:group I intron endonuclease